MTPLTEDEQLAQLQGLWQRHGRPLVLGIALASVGVLGWQFWQHQAQTKAQNASVLYQLLMNAALTDGTVDVAEVARLGNQLKADYPKTQYAQYARLFLAKVAADAGRLDDAAAELRFVAEQSADSVLKELARERLARIWAAQNEPQRGLDVLSGTVDPVFQASRSELKGDLLLQLGRIEEARKAYLDAKQAANSEAPSTTVQLKLDDLALKDTPNDA